MTTSLSAYAVTNTIVGLLVFLIFALFLLQFVPDIIKFFSIKKPVTSIKTTTARKTVKDIT